MAQHRTPKAFRLPGALDLCCGIDFPTYGGTHLAHKQLDHAILDAYGWPHELSDEEILERLLALNLERAGREKTDAN